MSDSQLASSGRLLIALALGFACSLRAAQPEIDQPISRRPAGLVDPGIAPVKIRPRDKHPAQLSRQTHSGLAVDRVVLKSGITIRGVIVWIDADGALTMAVSRQWMSKSHPELLAKLAAEEKVVRRTALEQLRDRIKKELDQTAADSPVSTFLRLEQKRVEKLSDDTTLNGLPQFVWLDVPRDEMTKVIQTTLAHRRIAAWSWSEQLPNVETEDAADLARKLNRKGIDPTQFLPDLASQISLRLQSDREWSARMAIVRYALEKPLEFQGTGEMLVRVDRTGNANNTGNLIAKLLGQQVDSLLKDLLNDGSSATAASNASDAWLKTAYREAERERVGAFRATRVDFDVVRRQASVYSVFVVRPSNGNWRIVWSDRDTQDGMKERAAIESSITKDPQVKTAVRALQTLGTVADEQLQQAVRFGAATMAAQQTVDSRFAVFENPLVQHLGGPPLWWSK